MPCLNEAETVGVCVAKARRFIEEWDISGEVLVSDNGSVDGSQEIALRAGARVVSAARKGYGAALIKGIQEAHGEFVVMGDADDSYDFSSLELFLERLRAGSELVMGDRFAGGIEPNAMPILHRYLGNPVLSALGRIMFNSKVRDFHCGLRGFRKESISSLYLSSTGMEFASEMVVKASLAGLLIDQVPTKLYPDGRSRPPHLRTWRDGWRHLRFLLLLSPRWLFLFPGLILTALGFSIGTILMFDDLAVGSVVFSVNSLAATSGLTLIGYQAVWFGVLSKAFAVREGLLPKDPRVLRFQRLFPLEIVILGSVIGFLFGALGMAFGASQWARTGWAELSVDSPVKLVVGSVTLSVLSAQTLLSSLMLSILSIGGDRSETR